MAKLTPTWREEWRQWWQSLPSSAKIAPLFYALSYWGIIHLVGKLAVDHVAPVVVLVGLYYAGPKLRSVYEFALPFILVIVVYDSQRYYADYIRGPIHVKEPYDFDKKFFGMFHEGQLLTPPEWFQLNTHWILDLITGFFYIAFIPIFVLISIYFRFRLNRVGTAKCSARYIEEQSPQIMWSYFWLNVIGFSTYYWYAASPPWYAAMYGFGPARTDVPASPAGCARFDALLGTTIFNEWYGRSADVHGAIPSLHIAYPLLTVYYAFKFGALRLTALQYYLWLCFSAVYLNQHYFTDVIIGSIYALTAAKGVDIYWNWKLKQCQPSQIEGLIANSPNHKL